MKSTSLKIRSKFKLLKFSRINNSRAIKTLMLTLTLKCSRLIFSKLFMTTTLSLMKKKLLNLALLIPHHLQDLSSRIIYSLHLLKLSIKCLINWLNPKSTLVIRPLRYKHRKMEVLIKLIYLLATTLTLTI